MAAPSAVFTIARVAEMLGEDVDWLSGVALEMDPEDGCLTVYDVNDEATTAFTSFGLENLKELIEIHKANPSIIEGCRKLD
ncbi:MAG: hypothetical protein JOY71_26540 [Acetobacteraceae bacterium]|nr:hypothetical protein [Acetobacteraceae bacterium]